ncbi:MAG: DUF4159 domain-containing protein [Candidatus Zixiibacteriota bacterium]|nr:MAG: DUF4159 domain-containing protein [candidate division Zixibacteria bacterium]
MSQDILRYALTGIISLLVIVPAVVAQSTVGRQAVEAMAEQPRPVSRGELHLAGRFHPDPSALKVARLHYSGGGDWYWGSSAIPNFLKYVRDETGFPVDTIERQTTIMEADLFKYPFLFATGHGVMEFSAEEKERLRTYLQGGGFLFVNDSYGMADSFLGEMRSLFPEREVVELPFDHDIYHCFHDFPTGPPKIHEHDGDPPRGYALILNGRVVLYFLVESDIGDGWEDQQVHNDPPQKRLEAFRMGLNVLTYALLY